jgi:rubrerythrin
MFTAEQYRAKAAEFNAFLADTPRSANETSEFRNLAQTYTTLAENEEWMAVHLDKTIQRRKGGDDNPALAEAEEQIFEVPGRCRDHALEYGLHETPEGTLRLR